MPRIVRHLLTPIFVILFLPAAAPAQLYITELMAVNDTTVADQDGDYPDWLEIYNAGGSAVDLNGWYLSDDAATLTKWQFPATPVSPGGYLLVFASDKDRASEGAELHTNFKLSAAGEYLALVRADAATVEHEYAPEFPPQTVDVSYGLEADLAGERCFLDPTPGAANDESGSCGTVEELVFSTERGFFDLPISVSIGTATSSAEIYYTLNGREPTPATGQLYSAPIPISTTTTLRAAGFSGDLDPTPSVTHTYIFLDDVLVQTGAGLPDNWAADYEMDAEVVGDPLYASTLKDDLRDIPTLSMVMDLDDLFDETTGIYNHPGQTGIEWERPVSAELIFADDREGFQINCGTRIQGDLSRALNRKKSFRLAFKSMYGPAKLDYPLFGPSSVTSFDKIRLRASSEKAWSVGSKRGTYIRDQWVRDTQLAMGRPASRGIFVHLYLNGLYWGLYNAVEKPDESFTSAHMGGSKDEWDVLKHPFEVVNGSRDVWDDARAVAEAGLETPGAYAAIQNYIDVPNLIDYFIANIHAGTTDWDGNNWYAARRRAPGEGFKFFSWDSEQSMVSVKTKRTTIANQNRPSMFYAALRDNAEFRMLFGDHVHRHFFNGGALTEAAARDRLLARAAEIDRAIVGESARWGDADAGSPITRDKEWLTELEWLRLKYFPRRTAIVLDQLRDIGLYPNLAAPAFSQHGGFIPPAFELAISAPDGAIYYTLDGIDPRLSGGAVSPGALTFSAPVILSGTTTVKSRAYTDGRWSALNKTTFAVEVSLRVSELMYHPSDPPPESPFSDEDFEFVELTNIGATPIDLAGIAFTDGIGFAFPAWTLNPGGHVLIVSNPAAFESRYGSSLPVAGQYSGRLGNAGERVRMAAADGQPIQSFTYDDGWYPDTDGGAYSLVALDTGADNDAWSLASNWRAGAFAGGSPGTAESPLCSDGIDNDGDGLIDFGQDPGCAGISQDMEDPECDDGIDNDGDGAVDGADLRCTMLSEDQEAFDPVDSFICYQAKESREGERFVRLEVTLDDEFDPPGPYTVRRPETICLPASVDGSAVTDEVTHLQAYSIRETDGTPPHTRQRGVFVEALGPIFMDTGRPEQLLVPTAMDPNVEVAAPDTGSHLVDHYKCYKARTTTGTPKYFPKGVELRISAAFEDRRYKISRPNAMCMPVDKNGEGIKNPDGGLLCYKVKLTGDEPKHARLSGIYTNGQFGPGLLDTKKARSVCVPLR